VSVGEKAVAQMNSVLAPSIQYREGRLLSNMEWIVLGAYYLFVFSLPLQNVDIGLSAAGTISRLSGYLFIMATLLKPKMCYKKPGIALYCFGIYVTVYLCVAFFSDREQAPYDVGEHVRTLVQLLVFFAVSSNLLTNPRIVRRTIFALASSCIVLAVAMVFGFTGEVVGDRLTALNANPNEIAQGLMVGILALVGLGYGTGNSTRRSRFCFWIFSGFLFLALIRTGSRAAVLSLVAALFAFLIKRSILNFNLKRLGVVILSLVLIVIISSSIESISERWKKTFVEGDTAGRDEITYLAWHMFLEQPWIGWGVVHQNELGSRLGLVTRDFHNLFFHVLTEVGLIGTIPFFFGILTCSLSAWRARKNIQGILPLAMLLSLLVMSVAGTTVTDKLFWFVLAYANASGASVPLTLWRHHPSRLVFEGSGKRLGARSSVLSRQFQQTTFRSGSGIPPI
jgi:O-antigen ligase